MVSTDGPLDKLIADHCNRAIRSVLVAKDRLIDPYVSTEAATEFRRVVLHELNGFADFVIDVIEAVRADGVVLNELWLTKIDEMHRAVTSLTMNPPVSFQAAVAARRASPARSLDLVHCAILPSRRDGNQTPIPLPVETGSPLGGT